MQTRTWKRMAMALLILLAVIMVVCAVIGTQNSRLLQQQAMQQQREIAEIKTAMADMEVNLAKLMIAGSQTASMRLLGETALLAQYVESGLSRLPIGEGAAGGMMKFAGQVGEYAMALNVQVGAGGMLSDHDQRQIGSMLTACRVLNAHLKDARRELPEALIDAEERIAEESRDGEDDRAVTYPTLIYDGPFSDSRQTDAIPELRGERVTREQARQRAAEYAGTTLDKVEDSADSGGMFEAFGFDAATPDGKVHVQVTGIGGRLLWMVPEQAEFAQRLSREECIRRAADYLAQRGFGEMQPCFVQQYDGMIVANFAAVQDGVLLYPDQVKLQVSMDTGRVVGAECTQYLTNHTQRKLSEPKLTREQAEALLDGKLSGMGARLCLIPLEAEQVLCWEFEAKTQEAEYRVYVDAQNGKIAQVLCIAKTRDGEMAI